MVGERLRRNRLSGRTITVKVRLHDFSTHTRSATLPGPTDDARAIARTARRLVTQVDTSGGVRLLGVGVSSLADWIQEDLFGAGDEEPAADDGLPAIASFDAHRLRRWAPGADVVHAAHGRGWVWGSGLGRVTVRFETAESDPGPVRTFAADDPDLAPAPRPRADTGRSHRLERPCEASSGPVATSVTSRRESARRARVRRPPHRRDRRR